MAYDKRNFSDGQVLTAAHLNYMEDGIVNALAKSGSVATIGTVNLISADWVGDGHLFSQVVSIAGVTENSQVDLTPSVEQLLVFYEKDLTFVTENDNGVVTVFVIGQKPQNDYTIQVSMTVVMV